MTDPIPQSITSLPLELDYDFSSVVPIASNSTLVGSVGGEFVIDFLFIDPFTLGKKPDVIVKGFDKKSSKKSDENIKMEALPMARIMLSPTTAISLFKQIKGTLEQLNIPIESLMNAPEGVKDNA